MWRFGYAYGEELDNGACQDPEGTAEVWDHLEGQRRIPLEKTEATWFEQVVKDACPVDPQEINAADFMLGNKKFGPFKIEIEWIKVERAGASK